MPENEDRPVKNAKGGKEATAKKSDNSKNAPSDKKGAKPNKKPKKWYVITVAPAFGDVIMAHEGDVAEEYAALKEAVGNSDDVHVYELGRRVELKTTLTISPLSTK